MEKVTNHKINRWAHLGKVALVIYHGFEYLEAMYLQNYTITWCQVSEKVTNKLEKLPANNEEVTSVLWRSYQRMEQSHKP